MTVGPSTSLPATEYDYIVVGAGSAGCVAAARLAEKYSVILLEAGDHASTHPETGRADGFGDAFCNDALMWPRMTTKQKACGNRPLYAGTGRGTGGSGCVNGMVYTRGDRQDFNRWPSDWQWADIEPAFQAIEEKIQPKPQAPASFTDRCIAAAANCGLKQKNSLNDGDLGGFIGYNDMNQTSEQRRSAWQVYIEDNPPANLDVITGFLAHRLCWNDAGNRITGVVGEHLENPTTVTARKEVLLCAGALVTPKLLMLSGIGPANDLTSLGITVRSDHPDIGANLHDHPNVCLFYRGKQAVDFYKPQLYAFDSIAKPDGAPDSCFVLYSAAGSLQQSIKRMLPMMALPQALQKLKWPTQLIRSAVDLAFRLPMLQRYVAGVFGMVVILGKPFSRGRLRLASSDPRCPPIIDPAYFSDERDQQTLLSGIGKAKQIVGEMAKQPGGARPMSQAAKTNESTKILQWMQQVVMTTFHFCGTCRMGDDSNAPVDTQLRVRGIEGLRVADASAIPEIPVSAINAPSMMIGWRAAEFILQEPS